MTKRQRNTTDVIMFIVVFLMVIVVGFMMIEHTCWSAVKFCYEKEGVQYAGNGITIDCSNLIRHNTTVSTCSQYWRK